MKFSKLYRIYLALKLIENNKILLEGLQYNYLHQVLRCRIGFQFRLFNERDGEFLGSVVNVNKRSIEVEILKLLRLPAKMAQTTLMISIIKQDKMIDAIIAATQLGVTRVVPIIAERSQSQIINHERLTRCILESTEQSERLMPPVLLEPMRLDQYDYSQHDLVLWANENEENQASIKHINANNNSNIAVFIGPEGGFTDNEVGKITTFPNIYSLNLGNYVLRSEIAATSALSFVNCIRSLCIK